MNNTIKGAPLKPRVKQVTATDDYKLSLMFNNGEIRQFDVKPLLKYPMYAPLKNIGFFKSVKSDNMCVYWNDEIDICPDTIYESSIPCENFIKKQKNNNRR